MIADVEKVGRQKKMFKVFVSDLDGTLLTKDHHLGEYTIKTLRRLMDQGVHVVLCSGRSAASIRPYALEIGSKDPIVAFNGAQILSPVTGEKLACREIPVELAGELLEWMKDHQLYAQLYDGDDWFYDTPCVFSERYCISSGIIGKQVPSLSKYISNPAPKILGVDTDERVAEILPNMQKAFEGRLNVTTSAPYFIEVTAPGADKGFGMEQLSKILGNTPEDTICAGDSLNDMAMLRWTKHPITVSNARDEVKAIAEYVGGSAYEDGVAHLLDRLIP